ncbi:ribonuclease H-like domain-containing protein [Lachnospiraceae bacterium 46-15]
MITITDTCKQHPCPLPWQHQIPPESVIFDIETTGFSPKSAFIYLVGALTLKNGSWQITQWLAESPEDEPEILSDFLGFLSGFRHLIHFNGEAFDLPFLKKRCKKHKLPCGHLDGGQSIDLYRMYRPLKKFLGLSSMNLKALENFLEYSRGDELDGQKLIAVYHEFSRAKSPALRRLLLLHNHDDLLGTAALFPLSAYLELLEGAFSLNASPSVQINQESLALTFSIGLHTPVPRPISIAREHGNFTASGSDAALHVHGIYGTLKHFFDDYRSYYYLPLEDTAIHKSVAAYVDKEHRIPAKASNCYCKKRGHFLPGFAGFQMPKFYQSYGDPQFYHECTEAFLEDSGKLYTYITDFLHTLQH